MSITTDTDKKLKVRTAENLAVRVVEFAITQMRKTSRPLLREDFDKEFSATNETKKTNLSQVLINLMEYGWLARKSSPVDPPYFWVTSQACDHAHLWAGLPPFPPLQQRSPFLDLYSSASKSMSYGLVRHRTNNPIVSEFSYPSFVSPELTSSGHGRGSDVESGSEHEVKAKTKSADGTERASIIKVPPHLSSTDHSKWDASKLNLLGQPILLEDHPRAHWPQLRSAAMLSLVIQNPGIPEKVLIQYFTLTGMKQYLIERALTRLKNREQIVSKNSCLTEVRAYTRLVMDADSSTSITTSITTSTTPEPKQDTEVSATGTYAPAPAHDTPEACFNQRLARLQKEDRALVLLVLARVEGQSIYSDRLAPDTDPDAEQAAILETCLSTSTST